METQEAVEVESNIALGMIRAEVDRRTKRHGKNPGALKKSFRKGKVQNFLGSSIGRITTSAPHYHLVEEGHEESGWYAEQETATYVEGKKIVAKVMSIRSEHAMEIAEKVVDEVLKDLSGD